MSEIYPGGWVSNILFLFIAEWYSTCVWFLITNLQIHIQSILQTEIKSLLRIMTFRHIMEQVPKVRERWRDERRDEKDSLSQLLHVLWALLQTSAIQSSHHFFNYSFFMAVMFWDLLLPSSVPWALTPSLVICSPKLKFFLTYLSNWILAATPA